MKKLTNEVVTVRLKDKGLILLSPYVNRRTKVKLLCGCGKEFYALTDSIFNGKTEACGCYQKRRTSDARKLNLTNRKFYKLLCIKNTGDKDKYGNYYWLCLCDCGKYSKVIANSLTSNNTKSCGHCQFSYNGVATSSCVFTLNTWLPNAKHNYNIVCNNQTMNVDLCLVDDRIVIEYDEMYWHQHTIEKDQQKTDILIAHNWKVLRIKARRNLPKKDQFTDAVQKLHDDDSNYREIILDGVVSV